MLNNFKGALGDLIAEIILALIMRALDLIENGLCNSIGVLGAMLANSLVGQTGKSGFYDAVNDAFFKNEDTKKKKQIITYVELGYQPFQDRK